MTSRKRDQPTPVVRCRLVGGPFDGAVINTNLINGQFMYPHVRAITAIHAALYVPPLEFDATAIVDFEFDRTVTWDDVRAS